jgi:hypothetical protein
MDEPDFEARISARLHARFDAAEPSEGLLRRVAEGRSLGSQPERRRASVWVLVAALAVVVVAGFLAISGLTRPGVALPSPSPDASTSSPTTSPSAAANVPYRISVQTLPGSTGPTTTISQPSDCALMPSDWLLQICALTLRPDWQSIIAPTDPLGPRTSGGPGPTEVGTASWWAALARASIDGDTSFCRDASMRWWITLGSSFGASPQPGASPRPIHPVATCLNSFRTTVARGSFTLTDTGVPTKPSTVTFFVGPDATALLAPGAAPIFDPAFGCDTAALSRDTCNALLLAATTSLGADRQDQVDTLAMQSGSFECLSPPSPCPPPPGGTWFVVARTSLTSGFAFDVAFVGGQIVATEVPYRP